MYFWNPQPFDSRGVSSCCCLCLFFHFTAFAFSFPAAGLWSTFSSKSRLLGEFYFLVRLPRAVMPHVVPAFRFLNESANAYVDGIYESFVAAHNNLAPGECDRVVASSWALTFRC